MLTALITAGSGLFAADIPSDLNSISFWRMSSKWKFEDNVLSSDSGGFIFLNGSPQFNSLTLKAEIITERATGESWKSAGLGVFKDDDNFWRLSMVEAPGDKPKRYTELKAMNSKEWGTEFATKRIKSKGFVWEYGKKYVMILAITPKLIDGKILDESDNILAQYTFELSEGAVTGGTPILTTRGFQVKFSNIKLSNTEK